MMLPRHFVMQIHPYPLKIIMKQQFFLSVLFPLLALCMLLSPFSIGQAPQPPKSAEAAMNNGLQALKSSNWKQATEAFDLVLMLAPDYAPAYMGKLCAELTVTEEKLLSDLTFAIDEHRFFKSALEKADDAYKKQIQGYADANRTRVQGQAKNGDKDNRKAGTRMTVTINDVEYAFRWCPAGIFMMGSPKDEQGRRENENLHQVTLSNGFWMQETEVTQVMWGSVMGNNPSHFKGAKLPVEKVSWEDCQEYIKKLNELGVAPGGFKFALPTEEEWEYACRAGTKTTYFFGNTLKKEQANIFSDKTKEVGSYPANTWGLRDMHGNVWEWCDDSYEGYPRGGGDGWDPVWENFEGEAYVTRGGGLYGHIGFHRSAFRGYDPPHAKGNHLGFRLALVLPE
jgi:formylglycine-generating enzyme required for sulfatase activity